MSPSPPRSASRRRPLAPAFVATVSVLMVAAACSEAETPAGGVGETGPSGGAQGGVSASPSGGASQTAGAGGAVLLGGSAGETTGKGGSGGGPSGTGGSAGTVSGAGGTGGNGGTPSAKGGSGGGPGPAGSGGSAGPAGSSGSAGVGGMVNPVDCPAQPRMDDACTQEALTCTYVGGFYCSTVATCKVGRWKLEKKSTSNAASCNPPPPCPDDEPPDVDTASCVAGSFGGPSMCRYARTGCFAYISCLGDDTNARWRPGSAYENTCDSCCPIEPSVVGGACDLPGLLCAGKDGDVICRDGKWAARAPLPGAGGAAGSSGQGGGAGGAINTGGGGNFGGGGASGSSGQPTACPDYAPQMNDPCTDGLACQYESGCTQTASTCTNGRWKNVHSSAQGCSVLPECPDEEPANAASASCAPLTGYPTQGACRYSHGSCFRYLECGPEDAPRWKAPDYRAPDSCCPAKQPALGSSCDDDGAVCSWRSLCDPYATPTPLVCLGGTWQAPS